MRTLDRLQRLRRVARFMDTAVEIPVIGVRVGLDPLLGLLPVAGDVLAAIISGWMLVEARRLGAPWGLIGRMLGNVALDLSVGAVPLVGDLFDVLYRANLRNVALLEKHFDEADLAEEVSARRS